MKKFLYLLMAAALICSCEKNEELDAPILEKPIVEKEELTNGSLPESLYAYAAGNGDNQTRTVVSNEKVLWNKGDNIFYCTGQTIGAEYKYEGNDEVAKASFEKVGDGNRSEVMSTFPVGVFPYRDYFGAKFNVNKLDDETDDTWTITPDFEQFQNYVPNSFDKDANIMIAAGNGEDNNLSFRNACGYVVVSLYGTNVKVDNVQLHANYTNNASIPRICGKLYGIEVKPNGELTYGGNNLSYSPWQNMVELNCVNSENPQGVQISDDPNNPTEFWFALPPMVLKDGFFLRVEDSNGNIVGKNTDKSFEIERNKVKRMAAVDASNPKRTHRLWYKTTNTTYSRPLKKFDELEKWEDYFDAKIIAHTWDTNSPNGKGHKMFYIEFDRPLTEIKAGAFKDAGHSDDDELIEIILPETLTTIGESAFKNTGIKTLKITDKVTHIGQNAFADCEELTSVTFESITTGGQMTIGNGAFQKSGLTSISIPGKVTHIGQYAFANCETLTSVTIESGSMGELMTIGKGAFQYSGLTTITIPRKVVCIEQEAFADCESLKTVTFESGSTPLTIGSTDQSVSGDHPFDDSNNITTLSLDRELVKAHGDVSMALFENHESLNSVTLGGEVKTIYNEMFYNTGITSITIPGSVTRINYSAFSSCANLKTVTFEPSNTNTPITIDPDSKYNNYTPFYGSTAITTLDLNRELVAARTGVSMALFEDHTNLTSVTLGGEVKTIHSHMFDNIGITSIEIPGNVITIGSDAFAWCKALQSVTIAKGLERERSIGNAAFYECVNLNSITLNGIATIGERVFYDCKSLTSLEIPGSVNVIGNHTFDECTGLTSVTFADGEGSLIIGFNPNTNERGPFYNSPLTEIKLNRNLVMTEEYANAADEVDEGIFSYKNYSDHSTTLEIGSSVKEILPYMFAGSGITSVKIPANVSAVGYNAFQECTKLSTVEIEASSTQLTFGYQHTKGGADWGPFYDSPLTSITLERDIKYVKESKDQPFTPAQDNDGLFSNEHFNNVTTQLEIGDKVTNILPYMFSQTGITSVEIPASVSAVGYNAFLYCYKLKEVSIPEASTPLTLGYQRTTDGAEWGPFYDSPLEKVTFNRDINFVDKNGQTFTPDEANEGVFATDNDKLTSIKISDSVTKILPYMFAESDATSVWIPHTIRTIGNNAFDNCDKLYGVTLGFDGKLGFDRPSIGKDVFDDCSEFYYIKVRESVHERFITNNSSDEWFEYQDWITTGPFE